MLGHALSLFEEGGILGGRFENSELERKARVKPENPLTMNDDGTMELRAGVENKSERRLDTSFSFKRIALGVSTFLAGVTTLLPAVEIGYNKWVRPLEPLGRDILASQICEVLNEGAINPGDVNGLNFHYSSFSIPSALKFDHAVAEYIPFNLGNETIRFEALNTIPNRLDLLSEIGHHFSDSLSLGRKREFDILINTFLLECERVKENVDPSNLGAVVQMNGFLGDIYSVSCSYNNLNGVLDDSLDKEEMADELRAQTYAYYFSTPSDGRLLEGHQRFKDFFNSFFEGGVYSSRRIFYPEDINVSTAQSLENYPNLFVRGCSFFGGAFRDTLKTLF